MAGDTIIQGAQPVEYVEESSFATAETDATYNWFGIGTSWSATQGVNSESITYLPEYGATNKLEKRMNVKQSEMWEAEITYHPQGFGEFQYWSGSSGGTSDNPSTLQVGEINESADPEQFRRLLGGMGEELTFSVGEDETAEVTGSFIFADGEDWTDTDYVGTAGAHATEDTTEPFAYKDLGNITYGGTAIDDAIESLEFTISNDIAVVKDPDASRQSLITALIPVNREITVDLSLTYAGFGMASEVRSYQPKDLVFDVDTTTFTITGVRFPEFPYEFTADDLVSDSLSSDPCSSISWA